MFNVRDIYTTPLNMHQGRGDQTKHTLFGTAIFFYLKEIILLVFLLDPFFFPAADRIKTAVLSWETQGEGLVFGRESDPVSSYAFAIQIKHFFHARNTLSCTCT